jgi:hypothetical protein
MSLFSNIVEFFVRPDKVGLPKYEGTIPPPPVGFKQELERGNALPTKGGRVSLPDYTNLYALFDGDKTLVNPDVPKEILNIIAHLAKYNADVSHAVENVVALGNTKDSITFEGSINDSETKRVVSELRKKVKLWYSGGITNLRGDLLNQVAIYGCVSAEIVVNERLDGVAKIVLVNPQNIEFVYSPEKNEYLPYQRVSNFSTIITPTVQNGGLIPLNPTTYKYVAVRRHGEKPYAVPPFLSALESIKIEKDMMDNFKHVIHKLGVLGFLHALVTAPKKDPNEAPEKYQARCQQFLSQWIVPELEKGLAQGVVVGFKDTHEFKVEGNNTNVAGARDLFNMITELKMSGLKQDPRLLGRQFSTTETYGKVIMTKFTSQINSYQLAVDEFISNAYLIELMLSGSKVKYVEVVSELPTVNDELNDQEAYGKKIENYTNLYKQGIIGQQQLAQELGFDEADLEEPRPQATPVTDVPKTPAKDTQNNELPDNNDVLAMAYTLGSDIEPFDYGVTCECGCEHHDTKVFSLAKKTKFENEMERFMAEYWGAVHGGYSKATKKVARLVGEELATLGTGATQTQVKDAILFNLFKHWAIEFTEKQEAVIAMWVKKVHKFFRSDSTFVKGWTGFDPANPPKAVFGVLDYRVMEYYKKSDKLYLGKFITDEDTQKKITEFIKERYIGQNLPIGKGSEASIKLFRQEFAELLQNEDWKITRIISTTVNRMRNTAGAMYMADAGVEKYKILGVNDRLQCDWCKSMQGKEFSVAKSKENIQALALTEPSMVASLKPFVTSQLDAKTVGEKTGEELQALGFDIPPFHCHCRDTIAAIL